LTSKSIVAIFFQTISLFLRPNRRATTEGTAAAMAEADGHSGVRDHRASCARGGHTVSTLPPRL